MGRLALLLLFASLSFAQVAPKAQPAKPDLPYLQLADDLVPTEGLDAQQESKSKGDTTYWIAGEHSAAKTPLASPIFIIKKKDLLLDRLNVYPFDLHNGRREITFSRKRQVQGFTLTITNVHDDIFRLEVNESLPAGEYAITPSGTNQVFCFAVY